MLVAEGRNCHWVLSCSSPKSVCVGLKAFLPHDFLWCWGVGFPMKTGQLLKIYMDFFQDGSRGVIERDSYEIKFFGFPQKPSECMLQRPNHCCRKQLAFVLCRGLWKSLNPQWFCAFMLKHWCRRHLALGCSLLKAPPLNEPHPPQNRMGQVWPEIRPELNGMDRKPTETRRFCGLEGIFWPTLNWTQMTGDEWNRAEVYGISGKFVVSAVWKAFAGQKRHSGGLIFF